jgi:hypothetical protein
VSKRQKISAQDNPQGRIHFHGNHPRSPAQQAFGERAFARADFDYQRFGRRRAGSASNALEHSAAHQEMLAKFLS